MNADQLHQIFMQHVRITDACWTWEDEITSAGYGRFYVDHALGLPRRVMAHRWMYVRVRGPVMPGLVIDHICMNKICVRPDHLQAITHGENVKLSRSYRSGRCKKDLHDLSPDNVYVWHGKENCRACRRTSNLASYHRTKPSTRS